MLFFNLSLYFLIVDFNFLFKSIFFFSFKTNSNSIARPGKTRYQKDLAERIKDFKNEMSTFRIGDPNKSKNRRRKTFNNNKPGTHSLLIAPINDEQKLLRFQRSRSFVNSELTSSEEQCPLTLRYKILFDRKVDCKCKRNIVPVISDVEFDKFLRVTPQEQLIVIAVMNSK